MQGVGAIHHLPPPGGKRRGVLVNPAQEAEMRGKGTLSTSLYAKKEGKRKKRNV